jgi:hypothetical protein
LPADTTLYSFSPYLTVTADTASFSSNVTFSGYLKYNWLTFKLSDLYFDIDVGFASSLELTARSEPPTTPPSPTHPPLSSTASQSPAFSASAPT